MALTTMSTAMAALATLCLGTPAATAGDPAFVEVATELGLAARHAAGGYTTSDYTGGGAAGDFNNDGCQDIFVISGGIGDRPDRLYINNCDGTFTEAGEQWGLTDAHLGKGCSVADYDNDGFLDIYVTSAGLVGNATAGRHRLYRNNGDNTFSEVAQAAGLNATTVAVEDGFGSAWGDFDLDGDLDLFVAGFAVANAGNRLFENNGDGTFTDITAAIGLFDDTPVAVAGFIPVFADANGDFYPELLLAADFGTSRYFANLANGTFADLTDLSGTSQEENGTGAIVGDFNADGNLDWYVTSIYFPSMGWTGNKLYVGNGDHTFNEVSVAAGVEGGGYGWGTVAVDFNHDGMVDLAETGSLHNERSHLWVQASDGTYSDLAIATGFAHTGKGRGMINLDYDNDGDQDVMIFANNGRPYFLRNEIAGPDARWLRVFLNTDNWPSLAPGGIGAKVHARVGDQTQMRYVSAGQSELSAHFGLGSAVSVDQLLVDWPDGSRSFLYEVPANDTITVVPTPRVPGDADGDGEVGIYDLLIVLGNWGPCPNPCPPSCQADFDDDCIVGIMDLLIVLGNWTKDGGGGSGTPGCDVSFGPGPSPHCPGQVGSYPFSITNNGDGPGTYEWTIERVPGNGPQLGGLPVSGGPVTLAAGASTSGSVAITPYFPAGTATVELQVDVNGDPSCYAYETISLEEGTCAADMTSGGGCPGDVVPVAIEISGDGATCDPTFHWSVVDTGAGVFTQLPSGSVKVSKGRPAEISTSVTLSPWSPPGPAAIEVVVTNAGEEVCSAGSTVSVSPTLALGLIDPDEPQEPVLHCFLAEDAPVDRSVPVRIINVGPCPSTFQWALIQTGGTAVLTGLPSGGSANLDPGNSYDAAVGVSVQEPGDAVIQLLVLDGHVPLSTSTRTYWFNGLNVTVDSNNDGEISEADDDEEEMGSGRFLLLNNIDSDGDGHPDFADGFNLQSGPDYPSDSDSPDDAFVQMNLTLEGPIDSERITVQVDYAESPPLEALVDNLADPPVYTPAPGALRVWTADAAQPRSAADVGAGGHYVVAGQEYSIGDLGFAAGGGTVTLWVESVSPSDVQGDQDIRVTVRGYAASQQCDDRVTFTTIGTQLVDATTMEVVRHPTLSHPTPQFSLDLFELGNARPSADNTQIVADLVIAGTLDDAASDMLAGTNGVISTLRLYLDEEPLMVEGGVDPVTIELSGAEISKSSGSGMLLKQYDFEATFVKVIQNVAVGDGWNRLRVEASNYHGLTGDVERTFNVITTPPDSRLIEMEVEWEEHPYLDTVAVVTFWLDGEQVGLPVTLISTKPGIFSDVTNTIVIAALEPDLTLDPLAADGFHVTLTNWDLEIENSIFVLNETGVDTVTFEGSRLFDEHDFDWSEYQFEVVAEEMVASNGGTLSPFMVEVLGPGELSTLLTEVSVGFESIERSYGVVPFDDGLFLAQPGQSMPEVLIGVKTFEELFEEQFGEWRDGTWNYFQGVGAGLGDSVVGFVDSVGALGKGLWYVVWNYNTFAWVYRLTTEGQILLEEDQDRLMVAWDVVQTIADVVSQIQDDQEELIEALLVGDYEQIALIGQEYQLAFEFAAEILHSIEDELNGLDDYEAGRIVGRIFGEVIVEVGLALATAGAGNVAKKAATSTKVINKLNNAPDAIIPPAVKTKLLQLLSYFDEMQSTSMCFVAGTSVLTMSGFIPIEAIRPGDLVFSRDQETGAEGHKAVVATVVTHPAELFHVTVALPDGGLETFACTGEHPFFEHRQSRFVPARELAVGDVVASGAADVLAVTDLCSERSAPGSSHTTYNLEVEDWHTYFVGELVAWVHNASGLCEKAFAIYRRKTDHLNRTPHQAFVETEQILTKYMTRQGFTESEKARHLGDVVTEVVREIEGLPEGTVLFNRSTKYATSAENLYKGHWIKHKDEYADLPEVNDAVEYVLNGRAVSGLSPVQDDIRVGFAKRRVTTDAGDSYVTDVRVVMRASTREFVVREWDTANDVGGRLLTSFRPSYQYLLDGNLEIGDIPESNVFEWLSVYFEDSIVKGTEVDP